MARSSFCAPLMPAGHVLTLGATRTDVYNGSAGGNALAPSTAQTRSLALDTLHGIVGGVSNHLHKDSRRSSCPPITENIYIHASALQIELW